MPRGRSFNAGDFALSVQLLTRMASLLRLQARRIRAHRAPLFARHTSTAVFNDPKPLPPHEEWRQLFVSNLSAVRDRASVSNPRTASLLANAFLGGKSIVAGKGKTVIESYPGVCLAAAHGSDVFSSFFRPRSSVKSVTHLRRWRGREAHHTGGI